MFIRKSWSNLRHAVGFVLFVAVLITLLAFGIAILIVGAIGIVVSGVAIVPAVLITPSGLDSLKDACSVEYDPEYSHDFYPEFSRN